MEEEVAAFFATLGLKVDRSAWKAANAQIEGLRSRIGNGLAKASARVESILGGLGAKIGAAIAGAGVVKLSDDYTNLENRLRQVATSEQHLQELMARTKVVADDTRSSWTATGESFVRLVNATKDLGVSQDRALSLTETLNMALQSSGASASEAAAGSLQLMQGLASGALQGDEFRSIAEQLPDLLDLFAKEMKVSRGELKKLGADGKITSKVVIRSLENASGSIREKFGKSTKTAGQLWTVFTNNLTEAAGKFARDANLIGAIEKVLNGLSVVLPIIADGALAVANAIGEMFTFLTSGSDEALAVLIGIAVAIGTIVVPALYAMAAGWVAALAPVLAVVAAVAAVAYGVVKLIKHWDKVKATAGRAWDSIKSKAVAFWEWLRGLPGRLVDTLAGFGQKIIDAFARAWDAIKRSAEDAMRYVSGLARKVPVLGWVGEKLGQGAGFVVDQLSGDDGMDAINTVTVGPQAMSPPMFTPPAAVAGGRSISVGPTTVVVNPAPGMSEERIGQIAGAAAREQLNDALRAED